jgi:hypothetical protein
VPKQPVPSSRYRDPGRPSTLPATVLWDFLRSAAYVAGAGAVALACLGSSGCASNAGAEIEDGGAPEAPTTETAAGDVVDNDGEPAICAAFTSADAPCPTPSPVRCFPMCDAGGCYCRPTPQGPRWTCTTDTTCLPDCAPINDGC